MLCTILFEMGVNTARGVYGIDSGPVVRLQHDIKTYGSLLQPTAVDLVDPFHRLGISLLKSPIPTQAVLERKKEERIHHISTLDLHKVLNIDSSHSINLICGILFEYRYVTL